MLKLVGKGLRRKRIYIIWKYLLTTKGKTGNFQWKNVTDITLTKSRSASPGVIRLIDIMNHLI